MRGAVLASCLAGAIAMTPPPPAPARARDTVTVTGTAAVVGKAKPAADSSDVVVWLEPADGAERPRVEPARTHPRIVQRNKQFEPHLLVVTVGSDVDFPNLDPFFHNVFSLFDGKRFDLGLYEAGGSRSVRFTRAGVCYVFCNIHPEMSAVVVAVDTPYYAVSARDGSFAIADVPAGRYLLSAWHERHKPERPSELPRELRVAPGAGSAGVIRFAQSTDLVVAHKNKYGQDYVPAQPGSTIYIK
jgi:plastocyanin